MSTHLDFLQAPHGHARRTAAAAFATFATLAAAGSAHAQLVARPVHAAAQLMAWLHGDRPPGTDAALTLEDSPARHFWSQWTPRVGVVLDGGTDNPSGASAYVMAQPSSGGLKVQGLHILSDYPLRGGLHLTTGLVRGDASRPWWSVEDGVSRPLNLSIDRLDNLARFDPPSTDSAGSNTRAQPYIGAGYSAQGRTRLSGHGWRFNADLGVLSVNSGNIDRVMRVIQGHQSIETLGQDLRLRPMLKVSVKYAF